MKSSLSKVRSRISYLFFKDKFFDLIKTIRPYRKTFKGLYIYAIDGQECAIPVSEEIFKKGYRGLKRIRHQETYYPRMYLSQAFDVVNEITMDISFSSSHNENRDALGFLKNLEKNSLVLYDRAYICKALLDEHIAKENYFVFRCRSGGTFKEIRDFYESSRRKGLWNYNGLTIRLIKIKNLHTKEDLVLATNLAESTFGIAQIAELYTRRWKIETAFKDSVIQGLEQWHSKNENGLLQELFMHVWLMNWTRLQIICEVPVRKHWLKRKYKKPNLKLLVTIMVECVPLILKNLLRDVITRIKNHIRRTMQTRVHLTRHYPRVRKNSLKCFPLENVIDRRP